MLTNTKTNIFKFKCKPLHVTIWFNVGLVGLHNDCGGRRWLESSQKRFLTFASIAFAPAGRFVESPSCRNPADQLPNKFLVIGIWEAIYIYHTFLVYCLPNILGHFCNEMWSLVSNLRHVLHSHIILESEILNILLLICSDNMNNWHRRGELGPETWLYQ